MPKLNKYIFKTTLWDLQEIIQVTDEIKSWCALVQHESRFSMVDVDNITDYVEDCKTAGEQYIYLLELFYDKVRCFLHAVVHFAGTMPKITSPLHNLYVRDSNDISVKVLVAEIWRWLQALQEKFKDRMIKDIKNSKICNQTSTNFSQTDICSLAICENCHITREHFKSIILTLQQHFEQQRMVSDSATLKHRKYFQNTIDTSTDWNFIKKYTEAINADIKEIICENSRLNDKNLEALSSQNENKSTSHIAKVTKLKERIVELEKRHNEALATTKSLTDYKTEAELQLYKKSQSIAYLETKLREIEINYSELEKKCREEKTLHVLENSNLIENVSSLQSQTEHCATENKLLSSQLVGLEGTLQLENFTKTSQFIKDDAELKQRKNDLVKKFKSTKTINVNYQDEIIKLEAVIAQLRMECSTKDQAVADIEQLNKELSRQVIDAKKKLKETEKHVSVLVNNPDNGVPVALEVKGDPVIDIEKQLNANTALVHILQQRNIRFENVLKKLRARSSILPKTENK